MPEDCLSWHTDVYFQYHFLEIDVLGVHMMSLFQPYYVSFRTTHDFLMNNSIIFPFVNELNAKPKKTIKITFYGIFARTYWKHVDNTIKTCLTTTIGMRCRKYFYYQWNIKFRWNIKFFYGFQTSRINNYWMNVLDKIIPLFLLFLRWRL